MYEALISFSGLICMEQGEVRDIPDSSLADDLLNAGYIREIKPQKKKGVKDDRD